MASKQWAGEVISSRDKTTLSEEFQGLEKDIELRREGANKLLVASEAYQHALSKKKKNDGLEDADKLLPVDTLGIVMVVHGEEFGDDSAFGTSLVKLGRAHCKVATLQEAYALTLNDTFLASLGKFIEEIKEYDTQRKKLDSRRLSYDAAAAKFDKLKSGKKEKEKREAEEEMEKARQRYDETSEEVQAQMHAIQEKEIVQLRELTAFLDLELGFVEQYLNVLRDVKDSWYDESSLMQVPPRRSAAPPHVFPRPNSRMSNPVESEEEQSPPRKHSKRSDSVSSKISGKTPSRPPSRGSRKRTDSAATVGDEAKQHTKRISVAGWASSAVESVTGRSKKNKDKDKFATLNGDDEHSLDDVDENGSRSSPKKPSSFHSLTRKLSKEKKAASAADGSPKSGTAKILQPPSLQKRKVVRAMHSFSGGSDELSFHAGDEIVVINEVLDEWWMGELNGKKGLFPMTYTEPVAEKPPLPRRPTISRKTSLADPHSEVRALDDNDEDDAQSHASTDLDEDHDLNKQPLSAHHSSPFFTAPGDTASITSSFTDEDDTKISVPFSRHNKNLFDTGFEDEDDHYFRSQPVSRASPAVPERRVLQSLNSSPQPPFPRRATTDMISVAAAASGHAKKAPPPPPPRRSTITAGSGTTPPIPERIYKSYSQSSASQLKVPTPASSNSGHDRSPFDSVTDLIASAGGCGDFQQNPFQARGMCNNCFQHHG